MELREKRWQLEADGYCVVPQVLARDVLERLRVLAADRLAAVGREHREKYRSEGSLVPIAEHPEFAELIAYPPALAALAGLGFADVRFSSGYVISKPPQGSALFWHQDWWGWSEPISYTGRIAQVALFYYLSKTSVENGCLRVIPGSHRRRHPLHDAMEAHAEALAQVAAPDDPAFRPHAAEVAVEVEPGDLVIADARLLHGAYPNRSAAERTLLTLWYHPDFASLPPPIQARIHACYRRVEVDTDPGDGDGDRPYPDLWPEPARTMVAPLVPRPTTPADPAPWVRSPVNLH